MGFLKIQFVAGCNVSNFGYSVLVQTPVSNLRLLLGKTQDITSKFRIVLEKNIGRYILRKPNFRRKIILNSLIVPKNLKEGTLWDCEISIMLQNIQKIEGPFGDILKISKKKTKNRKIRILRESQSTEKLGRGDPLGFSKLQFAVKYQKT